MITIHVAVNAAQIVTVRIHRDGDEENGECCYSWRAEIGGEQIASGTLLHEYKKSISTMVQDIFHDLNEELQIRWDAHRQQYIK